MAKSKIYVVRKGHQTGIFQNESWTEVKKHIDGFSGAQFRSFTNLREAADYYESGAVPMVVPKPKPDTKGVWDESIFDYSGLVIFTDGSNLGDGSKYSFGMVILEDGVVIHTDARAYADEFSPQRNVAGELKGAIAALTYAKDHNYKNIRICYDYRGIEDWANGTWRANKELSIKYVNTVNYFRQFLSIEFVKVPAHSKVKYNDMADELAKGALGLL